MEIQKNIINNQLVNIINRKNIELTGVLEILSSTGSEIMIKLENSYMKITGENLTILKLAPEEKSLKVSGFINGINYLTKLTTKSIFKKVFK